MTKALFKKQMMEVFAWVYRDKKTGKRRSVSGIVGFAALYLLLFAMLGSMFFAMACMICEPLTESGLGWLYWGLMGLVSLFLAVFGSVFSTYATLYQAKDNDLLLSMPVPTPQILLTRLSGVYAIGLMYELIAIVPAQIVWFMKAPLSPVGIISVLLIPLVLSALALTLSAVLGWVVALIAGHLKHKNVVIVIASIAFMVAYYSFYSQAYTLLQTLLVNAQAVGDSVKSVLYPLYHMGRAAEGSVLSLLIFTAIIAALLLLVYALLSRSFLRLATANRGAAKLAYKRGRAQVRSVGSALLQKELRRFLGSANYMLNCSLGILFMPIAAGMLVWKADMVRALLTQMVPEQVLPLLAVGAICMMAGFNDIAAPSVSLEGKNLWLVQVFPVTGWQVLAAKMKLQLVLTLLPALPLIAAVEWLLQPSLVYAILIPVASALFILMMSALDLTINLKLPNLDWTSEIVPIKQSMSVTLALFGGWVIVAALAGLFFLVERWVNAALFLALVCGLMLAAALVLIRWLQTRGARLFETL